MRQHMVGALSFVPPGALQNYTASPADGLYLPPKNPHHNPPSPGFPLFLGLSPPRDSFHICWWGFSSFSVCLAINVLSFINLRIFLAEAQHPVSQSDGKIIVAAISMFQCFNVWISERLYSRRRWIHGFGHYCGNLPPDNSSGHWNDCRISADFVNKDTFKSLAGTLAGFTTVQHTGTAAGGPLPC